MFQKHHVTKMLERELFCVKSERSVIYWARTVAEGKHVYREACEEKKGWNSEVSSTLKEQWIKSNKQLRTHTRLSREFDRNKSDSGDPTPRITHGNAGKENM